MAYNLMIALIKTDRQSEAQLVKKANVFYACDRLTDDEYTELIALITGNSESEKTDETA